jgi:hypothetical protein
MKHQAVSCRSPPQRHVFHPTPVSVGFVVVDKVSLGQRSEYFEFPL